MAEPGHIVISTGSRGLSIVGAFSRRVTLDPMLADEKATTGLHALNAVIVHLRQLAFEGEAHERLAELADAAEILPMLIAREEDLTRTFRLALVGIAEQFPGAEFAFRRFDDASGACDS